MQKDTVKNIEEASTSLLMSVFKSEKTIDSQLPVLFKSGYILEEFNTQCHCCSAHLKGNQFKGSIFKVAKNSRFECWSVDKIDNKKSENSDLEKIMIDAVGFCPQCSVYTPCQVHVEDKGLSHEETEAREKLLEDERKQKRSKSFFGLTLQKMDRVKSQRHKIVETAKLNKLAKSSVSNILINPDSSNNVNKKSEFIKQSSIVKKSLVQNRVEEIISEESSNNIGKIDENITDMNVVANHSLMEAAKHGRKIAEPVILIAKNEFIEKNIREENKQKETEIVKNLVTSSEPKLGFLSSKNIQMKPVSIIEEKINEGIKISNLALTRKSRDEREQNSAEVNLTAVVSESLNEAKSGASLLLRGNRNGEIERIEPTLSADKEVLRRDSRGVKGSSTSAAVKIDRSTYVQSSLIERAVSLITGAINFIKNSNKNRKNNILKSYKYKEEKNQGRLSARNRLESLRENDEFERKPALKVKQKKHNHDSFR